METKTYTHIDRQAKEWPAGPWDTEPDKMQWSDPETEFPCLAVRHEDNGHWCGYVGVTLLHPLFGRECNELDENLPGHGGVNFSRFCMPNAHEEKDICHAPEPGEDDHVWWFGFDCDHGRDLSPHWAGIEQQDRRIDPRFKKEYRTLAYVQQVCAALAAYLYARQYHSV